MTPSALSSTRQPAAEERALAVPRGTGRVRGVRTWALALAVLALRTPGAAAVAGDWERCTPLPDAVGYAGMFAGTIDGQLVAGGGSQFRERPAWQGGQKRFSDRIYALAHPAGTWTELAVRLPQAAGHFASTAHEGAVYGAGGIAGTDCLRSGWVLRGAKGRWTLSPLPELPTPLGYAAAAAVAGRLYVVGGLPSPAAKTPTRQTWSLPLAPAAAPAHWRQEPELPDAGVFVAAAASDGRHLYLIGGIGYDAQERPVPSARVYRLAAGADRWERLPDLPEPRVGVSSPCAVVEGRIHAIGGYAAVFPGAAREHPGFARQTLQYDIERRRWERGPLLPLPAVADRDAPGDPGPAPMIAAPCTLWRDRIVIVGGEVRPSVRTPAVLAWRLGPPP